MRNHLTRKFTFNWAKNGCQISKETDISVPLDRNFEDYASMLASVLSIPCFALADFKSDVKNCIEEETNRYHNQLADGIVRKFVDNPASFDGLENSWAQAFDQNHKVKDLSESELFRNVYQGLLASEPRAVGKLLQKERELSSEMQELVLKRNAELDELQSFGAAMNELSLDCSDKDINEITAEHFKRVHELEVEYEAKVSSLADSQRQEYKDLIRQLGNEVFPATTGLSSQPTERERVKSFTGAEYQGVGVEKPKLEESFTIHLGAQMKAMHNLQLIAVDPLDLCRHPVKSYDQSQRLHMALSLYGDSLRGVVLLVKPRPRYHIISRSAFFQICEQSADLHFEDLPTQLANIEKDIRLAQEHREVLTAVEKNKIVSYDLDHSAKTSTDLQTGDVYVTRHSNLSQEHVVFHLVENDALRSSDIQSRHPCINGLRNVMRLAAAYDIRTLSIPLLLVDHMNENMTIPWCLKRAELVFKCVKGFMMESLTVRGSNFQEHTVQFIVPPEISPEMFGQLAEMMPQIFHIAGPLIADG